MTSQIQVGTGFSLYGRAKLDKGITTKLDRGTR
jgi:hypothetical protein